MSVTTPVVPIYVAGVDCSPEAIADRQRMIDGLKAKLASGVAAVGDRGRNVTYRTAEELRKDIWLLEQAQLTCALGYRPRRKALAYVDLVKGL